MDGGVAVIARERKVQEIMGKENFFGIKEAIKHFKVNPTNQDLNTLAKIPFSEAALEKLKNTHILVAVFPLSILDIRKANSNLFLDESWYKDESFAKERGETSWQLVRKTPIPNSTSKNWSEQQALLSKDDEVPSARVMVYTIIGYYLATGERLFRNIRVCISSLASNGYRVNVGYFDSDGLYVFSYWGDDYSNDLGVSSARKF